MPVLGDLEDVFKFYNNTGGNIPANRLVAINGYNASTRSVTCTQAVANGGNLRADGFMHNNAAALANQRMARAYREWIAENVNTGGRTIGDPVYLDPAAPGTWTFTKPSGTSQDVQEVGSVLTVNASTGRILFSLLGAGVAGFAAGSITNDRLASKMYYDLGTAGVAWIGITGAVADGDRVSIGGRIYEFDTAAPPGAIGAGANVRVGVSGGGGDQANNAAGAIAALVAAVNGDASRVVNAVDIGGDVAGFVALVAGSGTNFAISELIDGGNVINVSAAAATMNTDREPYARTSRSYTITAADVTELARTLGTSEIPVCSFASTTQPVIMSVAAFTAGGSYVSLVDGKFTMRQANAAYWVLCYAEPAGGAVLAAGDRVTVELELAD